MKALPPFQLRRRRGNRDWWAIAFRQAETRDSIAAMYLVTGQDVQTRDPGTDWKPYVPGERA